MIVDAYTLVGGLTVRPEPMGFAELFGQMTKAGVGRAAVTSLRGLNADARKGNDHLFSGAASDERLIPVGVVGPKVSAAELPSVVASCVANGSAALAFHVPPNTSLASLASRRAFAEIARPGLPLVACSLAGGGLPTQLAEMTAELGCPLYLAGTFYYLFDEVLAVVEEHDHVYVDPSWFPTPGAVELLVERAGPDRVLYASGATLRPMRPALNLVLDADLDEAVKRKILAANALRLFGRRDEADRVEASAEPLPAVEIPETPAIDVHNHFGEIPMLSASTRDVEAIELFARRAGFEYSVCSSYFAYYDDMEAGNREMLEKIEGRPGLLGSPVVNPTHLEASVRWLDMFAKNDRLAHATITPDTVLDRGGSEGYMALFAEAAKRGVPIFYNGPNWDFTRLPRYSSGPGYAPFVRGGSAADLAMLRDVGRRHPDLPIIIGHGLGEDGIRLAADTPNVYLELSGTYPYRGVLRRAIDTVGADRIVFGTDMDLILPAFALGIYHEADLSPEEDRLIMAENARRILRMPRAKAGTGPTRATVQG